MVASAGCLPMPLLRHHLVRFSAKLFAINSSRIPSQHKPPSDAKSGLGDLEKALGAKLSISGKPLREHFGEILKGLIEQKQAAPSLVRTKFGRFD
jgi:hypothetical protein